MWVPSRLEPPAPAAKAPTAAMPPTTMALGSTPAG